MQNGSKRISARTLELACRLKVRKYIHAFYRHPHHYVTAVGLIMFFAVLGHMELVTIGGFVLYAVLENVTGGD